MQKSKRYIFYAALTMPSGVADIQISGFNMVESQQSQRAMEIRAKNAELYSNENTGLLHNIAAKVWSAQSNIYEIQAALGILNTQNQDFNTVGDTLIRTPDAYRFQTQNVFYNAEKRHLSGTEPVVLQPLDEKLPVNLSQKFTLKGVGLFVDMSKELLRIENNVQAEQTLLNQEKLFISSQKFEFDSILNSARFFNNVQVRHPQYSMSGYLLELSFQQEDSEETGETLLLQQMNLRSSSPKTKVKTLIGSTEFRSNGFRILFDKNGEMLSTEAIGAAEAFLDDGVTLKAEKLYSFYEDSVQKIRMEEEVVITTPDRTANCGEAIYTPSTGDFILEKVASVSDADQIIRGERILFSTQHQKLKVEKASGSVNRDSLKR